MNGATKLFAVLFLVILYGGTLYACPVCYGQASGDIVEASNNAILTLLGITGFVLATIASFFIYLWRRTRKNRETISSTSYIDGEGNIYLTQDKGITEWNNS